MKRSAKTDRVIRHLAALVAALTLSCATIDELKCSAQETSPSPASNALGDTPWYDADAGAVIPVRVKEAVDDSLNRDSRWLPKAKRVKAPPAPATGGGAGGGTGGTGWFGTNLTIGNIFGWLLLMAIVCCVVGLVVYLFAKTEIDLGIETRGHTLHDAGAPDQQTIERMKHLPAELRRTDVNLRTEAERLMKEGQYDQAIILLFGHQLLLLDHAHFLRLNRGKTNGKYVRETRAADLDSAARLRTTVTAFERSYFGRHAVTQRDFAELWQNNLQLERIVQSKQEAAA